MTRLDLPEHIKVCARGPGASAQVAGGAPAMRSTADRAEHCASAKLHAMEPIL